MKMPFGKRAANKVCKTLTKMWVHRKMNSAKARVEQEVQR
jgi:hypothetical protein